MSRPRKSPPLKEREKSRLKSQLSIREQQFRLAVVALKQIVGFESAHLSVFQTEVHTLQRMALDALCAMELCSARGRRPASGKALGSEPLSAQERLVYLKGNLNRLYGRFVGPSLKPDGTASDE